nr:uncharacterized protein LOC127319121 [Lolium perenne]
MPPATSLITGEVNLAAAAEWNVEGGSTMEGEGLKILSHPGGRASDAASATEVSHGRRLLHVHTHAAIGPPLNEDRISDRQPEVEGGMLRGQRGKGGKQDAGRSRDRQGVWDLHGADVMLPNYSHAMC